MSKAKVTREVATNDVTKWLDGKKIRPRQRESYQDVIDKLIDCVEDGFLVVNEDLTLTQSLNFPPSEKKTHLTYKLRISTGELDEKLKGIKLGDTDGRLKAYVCAITGEAIGIIKKMDTSDFGIAQSIATFFLD